MEQEQMTIEKFGTDYPDLLREIRNKAKDEGKTEAIAAFNKLLEKFGEDPAFCIEQWKAGSSLEQAALAFAAKMKEQRDAAEKKAKDKKPDDPARQHFSDDQDELDKNNKPATTEIS